MASFIRTHLPSDFQDILAELKRKPLPNNPHRTTAGPGRSQAFGLQRRWSYTPYIGRYTWARPELWQLLKDFAEQFQIDYDAVQVNDNYPSKPHKDIGNFGLSYIVGFGAYDGGALNVEGTDYDIQLRGHLFNGAELLHYTKPWAGSRYSLVFFKIQWPTKFTPYPVTATKVPNGLRVYCGYNDEDVVLDKRGKVVETFKEGKQMPWIVRLSKMGQQSRNPLYQEAVSDPVDHSAL